METFIDKKNNIRLRPVSQDDLINIKATDKIYTYYMPKTWNETLRPLKIHKVVPTGVKASVWLKSKNEWKKRVTTIKPYEMFMQVEDA